MQRKATTVSTPRMILKKSRGGRVSLPEARKKISISSSAKLFRCSAGKFVWSSRRKDAHVVIMCCVLPHGFAARGVRCWCGVCARERVCARVCVCARARVCVRVCVTHMYTAVGAFIDKKLRRCSCYLWTNGTFRTTGQSSKGAVHQPTALSEALYDTQPRPLCLSICNQSLAIHPP